MASGFQLLPILARGREAVDQAYGRIARLASTGAVPCATIEGYNAVAQKQLALEQHIVADVKARGGHPPEDAPRSFALFGACTPGEPDAELSADARKAAGVYLKTNAQRAAGTVKALAKLYAGNAQFKRFADGLMHALAPIAKPGSESKPPPHGLSRLRLALCHGGTVWPIAEAHAVLGADFDVPIPDAMRVLQEATALGAVVGELHDARTEGEPKGRSPLVYVGIGAAALAAAGGGYYWWRRRKAAPAFERVADAPAEIDEGEPDASWQSTLADARRPEDDGPFFPRAGRRVDGRLVREHVPNRGSIAASLKHYEILPGIREVPTAAFTAPPERTRRTLALADEIRATGEINPLIVAVDAEGPYILEGGHRYDALKILGAAAFPALVVIERDDH